MTYQEPMPCEQLVRLLCDIKQGYTQRGGQRPFGVSLLYAGWCAASVCCSFVTRLVAQPAFCDLSCTPHACACLPACMRTNHRTAIVPRGTCGEPAAARLVRLMW